MEEKFLESWKSAITQADALGVRIRPAESLEQARKILSGHRESDGFSHLARLGRLDLSLEALAVKKQFTGLFSDEEANNALTRLLDTSYYGL